MTSAGADFPDLVCLSHLRWNFVFQRPQHLLTRCAAHGRVFFIEEFETDHAALTPRLRLQRDGNVWIAVPQLPPGLTPAETVATQRALVDGLLARERVTDFVLWYYTPMARAFTDHLQARAIVYDCMDELSAFAHAPVELKERERELLDAADVMFTGGQSLFEAKRDAHHNIYAFPSSVDVAHFATARQAAREPSDQAAIPHPRLGFFGVVDERMDMDLLAEVAERRPDWHIVLIGPIVKIDPATFPRQSNIHWLGAKTYAQLPQYIASWDVALLPFARNEATRFISPTKTPEYMAAGRPVVSTSIRDVVRPYGEQGLVRIADTPDAFVTACEAAMAEHSETRVRRADAFLRQTSWDSTWKEMRDRVMQVCSSPSALAASPAEQTV